MPKTPKSCNPDKPSIFDKLFRILDPRQRPEDADTDFMDPVAAAERSRPHRLAPSLLISIASFFIIAFIWAHWAELDQVTRGDGRVIPSSHIKIIDHLEGGIVRKILVREGEIVQKGQLLLNIDNTVSQARYKEGLALYYRALAGVERLKAQTENRPFEVPKEVAKNVPAIAQKERERYESAMARLNNETAIANRETEQRQQEVIELEGRLEQLNTRHNLALEELRMVEPLARKGIAPKMDLLRIKREVNTVKGDIKSTTVNITRAGFAFKQAQRRHANVEVAMRNEDLKELREVERRLSQAQDSITTEHDRLTRTDIRSPVRGIIKELLVNTISGVIQPGQDLLAIVPLEDTLLIEAQVRPSDVAFLRPGLHSIVKITAYDFALYGGLDAELVEISPDAIFDEEKRQNFFRIRLKTKKNYLGTNTNRLNITPGMTSSVDIITGKQTVWQYVTNPIKRASSVALRER